MVNYFDEQIIREIESKLDIVELISESVNLSRKGNRYWGVCPFHQEKTPSFSASREKQMFYCFGCHAGGNIFSYIMKRDGLEFREALEVLAAKAGVEIVQSRDKKSLDKHKQVIAVNNTAAEYYHQLLMSPRGSRAREYLQKRGITPATMQAFQLGYASDEWNAIEEYLLKKGFSLEYVKLSGLIKRSDNQDRYYDLFRDRVIFPINLYNRDVVGFGGRALGDNLPKYMNTPETEIFAKRRNLYGLTQAREKIRESNEAILVEGYMDCIRLQQAGIVQVVASLGTALTEEQASILRRYTEKVLILYDGDEAGQRETLRAIGVLRQQGLNVDVVTLPAGRDPDEYVDKFGKEGFLHYIQNNKYSHIEYKLDRYINSKQVLNLESKISVINLMKDDINSLTSALEKDHYIRIMAQKLRLEENLVQKEFQRGSHIQKASSNRNKTGIIRDNNKYGNYGIQEKILASMLMDEKIFTAIKDRIGINFFANPDYKTLANIYEQLQGGKEKKMQAMSRIVAEEGLEAVYARISMIIDEENPDQAREVEEFIKRVELKKSEAMWQKVFNQVKLLDDQGDFDSVLAFVLKLDKYINGTQEGGIL